MNLALIRRHFAATGGAELYLQRLIAALALIAAAIFPPVVSAMRSAAASR